VVLALATAIVGGLLATLPLLLTVFGVIQLGAALNGNWDPTWNDSDGWFGVAGAIALIVVLGAATALVFQSSRAARMPPRRTTLLSLAGLLVVAAASVWFVLTAL
jgi:hypothetical protein